MLNDAQTQASSTVMHNTEVQARAHVSSEQYRGTGMCSSTEKHRGTGKFCTVCTNVHSETVMYSRTGRY
jgi:hypothetical protein